MVRGRGRLSALSARGGMMELAGGVPVDDVTVTGFGLHVTDPIGAELDALAHANGVLGCSEVSDGSAAQERGTEKGKSKGFHRTSSRSGGSIAQLAGLAQGGIRAIHGWVGSVRGERSVRSGRETRHP
jgi:hypothetical protein